MVADARVLDRRKSIIRTIVVIALLLYMVVILAPFGAYWLPIYSFGIDLSSDPIQALVPHSAAADAGIQVGDRLETQYETLSEFRTTINGAPQGESVRLRFLHSGHERTVTLVAGRVHMSASDIPGELFWDITFLIIMGMGAALVLLRPGLMTWMFFFLTITSTSIRANGLGASPFLNWLPQTVGFGFDAPHELLQSVAPFVFALFALLFPNDQLTSWGRRVLPFILFGFVLSVVLAAVWQVGGFFFRYSSPPLEHAMNALSISGQLIALGALLLCYVQASAPERKRIAWVVAAFVIAGAHRAALDVDSFIHMEQSTDGIFDLGGIYPWMFIQVLLPIALAYSIMRHRLFDIEFVLSRTLVYTLLILASIGIFAAIDAVFTSRFHGSRVELAIDIAVALGLGFWVRAIQGGAIDLIDRLLFRRRYDARVRLKATLDAVNGAESPRSIEELVTSGAANALGLTSAVFFRRVADGGLLREIGFGWPPDALWHLLPDDPLVTLLDKHAPSIDLEAIGWSRTGVSPPQQPVRAVPMQSGGGVVGVTFYGSRPGGAPPSPDEVSGLVTLAQRAASVYLLLDSTRSGVVTRDLAAARVSR